MVRTEHLEEETTINSIRYASSVVTARRPNKNNERDFVYSRGAIFVFDFSTRPGRNAATAYNVTRVLFVSPVYNTVVVTKTRKENNDSVQEQLSKSTATVYTNKQRANYC